VPISHTLRCVFVHVPKTGGTSIETALGMFGPWQEENRDAMFGLIHSPELVARGLGSAFLQHLSMPELGALHPRGELAGYFSFSIVRNPWDRMVSVYRRTDPHLLEHAGRLGIQLGGLSFAQFLERSAAVAHAHLADQARFVCDDSDRVLVDSLGRFETLEEDFGAICRRLGIEAPLPRLNTSEREGYRGYYDERTRAFVARRYRRDIELFGYTF
jgi:Sulfotransferase family